MKKICKDNIKKEKSKRIVKYHTRKSTYKLITCCFISIIYSISITLVFCFIIVYRLICVFRASVTESTTTQFLNNYFCDLFLGACLNIYRFVADSFFFDNMCELLYEYLLFNGRKNKTLD